MPLTTNTQPAIITTLFSGKKDGYAFISHRNKHLPQGTMQFLLTQYHNLLIYKAAICD